MENNKNVGFIFVLKKLLHIVSVESIVILSSLLWKPLSKSIKEAKHKQEVVKQFVYKCTCRYYSSF